MIFGDRKSFALEVEIREREGSWVFGSFLLFLGPDTIGNPDDSVDLLGCRRWLGDLLARPTEYVDASLEALSPTEFFATVYDPAMARGTWRSAKYPDAFRQFSISQIGMSSFDRFDVLLVGLQGGGQRLFWREAGGEARAVNIAPGVFDAALVECVHWMDHQFARG